MLEKWKKLYQELETNIDQERTGLPEGVSALLSKDAQERHKRDMELAEQAKTAEPAAGTPEQPVSQDTRRQIIKIW